MITLLDTNILVRYFSPLEPMHPVAVAAVNALRLAGDDLCFVPQNVYEFWSTATRPAKANGLGLSVAECLAEVGRMKRLFRYLPDQPNLYDEWLSLVIQYQCHGKVSYDARIVAAMTTHDVSRLLTFNTADFARYAGLTVLDPYAVAGVARPVTP